ncbi:Lin1244/Lin1753 domain-containing protein [Psychroflexus aestuariivivens]|uniref:Lin1244/Lin1753 domain-containing protein n=1 Tax=Psychroflexus aestuariivivens TaxID=1795040 RepID=UPI000FDB419F|nr:Lin1244/Lin1753 domain-containing protein [Psychroflexus aestuariivivens]
MSKEAYYFSHDSNARQDEKILALRMKHGWEGYGIYWAIIEKLRDESDFTCVKDYNVIAFDLRTDAAIIKSIVEDFRLFQFTECGKRFYSESLMKRMDAKKQKSEKAKKAAEKRWGRSAKNENSNADEMRTQNKSNADDMQTHSKRKADPMQGKEKKVKESKVKESKVENKKKSSRFSPPSQDDVYDYLLEKKLHPSLAKKESEKFWHFYDSKNWMVGKNKMKKWKSAVSGWINRMSDFKSSKSNQDENTEKPKYNRQSEEIVRRNASNW